MGIPLRQSATEVAALIERKSAVVAGLLGEARPVAHLHGGGGTPTIFSPDHFFQIARMLRSQFNVGRNTEIAIEIDPRTLPPAQIEALVAGATTE